MPRVATYDEVLAAAKHKAQVKRVATNQANALGLPALPALPSTPLIAGTVEMTFVGPGYTGGPYEIWALITDPTDVAALDLKHKEANMDPARAKLPRMPIYSMETPYAIVRTVD